MSIEIKTSRKKKTSDNAAVTSYFKKFDIFGSSIGFQVNGQDEFKTGLGSFFTLLVFLTVIIYGANKWDKMI